MWLEEWEYRISDYEIILNEIAGRIRSQYNEGLRLSLDRALDGYSLDGRTRFMMDCFAVEYYRGIEKEADAKRRLQQSMTHQGGIERVQAIINGALSKGLRGGLALLLFDERYISGYSSAELDLKRERRDLRKLVREVAVELTKTDPLVNQ